MWLGGPDRSVQLVEVLPAAIVAKLPASLLSGLPSRLPSAHASAPVSVLIVTG